MLFCCCCSCSFCMFRLPMLGFGKAQHSVTVSSRLALAYIGNYIVRTKRWLRRPYKYFFFVFAVWSVAEPEVARGRDHSYIMVSLVLGSIANPPVFESENGLNRSLLYIVWRVNSAVHFTQFSNASNGTGHFESALKSKARNATRSSMAHSPKSVRQCLSHPPDILVHLAQIQTIQIDTRKQLALFFYVVHRLLSSNFDGEKKNRLQLIVL